MTSNETREYWNAYYADSAPKSMPPSQFAAFALGECCDHDFVLDIGCGNGRDAFFFGTFGKQVLGIDGSTAAIEKCREHAAATGAGNVTFASADVSSPELAANAASALQASQTPLIYSRFFIHAINEADEMKFLTFVRDHLGQGTLALEFRTVRDEELNKVTGGHYRRFVDPIAFTGRARDLGLETDYFVEGFGMAKYKQDDAYVARTLLKRASA